MSSLGVAFIGFASSVDVNILSEEVTSVLIRFSFTTSTASTVGSLKNLIGWGFITVDKSRFNFC